MEAVEQLTRSVCRAAIVTGAQAAWTKSEAARASSKGMLRTRIAGGNLYDGSGGIAIHLADASQKFDDHEFPKLARAAVHYAIEKCNERPLHCGFYAGDIGICYAAEHVGRLLHVQSFREFARSRVRQFLTSLWHDTTLDVIGGVAGSIPALLQLARQDDFHHAGALAVQFGEHLLRQAHVVPEGWCWVTMPTCTRPLAGLAHGNAGFGVALFALNAETGDAKYSYGGRQAFRYENALWDQDRLNWLDYRVGEVSKHLFDDNEAALRDMAIRGSLPAREAPGSMLAWCHGAPGIGLARAQVFKRFREREDRDDVARAVAAVLPSLMREEGSNHSLCHGLLGNAEFVAAAGQVLDRPEVSQYAADAVAYAVEQAHENLSRWITGAPQVAEDHSLLLGHAGIAHGLLRCVDATVASVLTFELCGARCANEPIGAAAHSPHERLAAADVVHLLPSVHNRSLLSDEELEGIQHVLRTRDLTRIPVQSGQPSERHTHDVPPASESLAADLIACQLLGERLDLCQDYLESLSFRPLRSIIDPDLRWSRSRRIGLIELRRIEQNGYGAPTGTKSELRKSFLLLERVGLRVRRTAISRFAAKVLESVSPNAPLSDIVRGTALAIGVRASAELEDRVAQQLDAAYRQRLVVCTVAANTAFPRNREPEEHGGMADA